MSGRRQWLFAWPFASTYGGQTSPWNRESLGVSGGTDLWSSLHVFAGGAW